MAKKLKIHESFSLPEEVVVDKNKPYTSVDQAYKLTSRMVIRLVVGEFLSNGVLSGKTLTENHPESVDNGDGTTSNGVIIPMQKWKNMMRNMEFSEQQSSSTGVSFWSASYKNDGHSAVSIINKVDWSTKTAYHALAIVFNDDEYTNTMSGNVEELYEKVGQRLIVLSCLTDNFSEIEALEIAHSSGYDRLKIEQTLIKRAEEGVYTYNKILPALSTENVEKYIVNTSLENLNF